MHQAWGFALTAFGVSGMIIAASRPRIGWWVSLSGQSVWVVYAVVTRQYGFIFAAILYGLAYSRLLRAAYADRKPKDSEPSEVCRYDLCDV